MTDPILDVPVSPLRQRLVDDMAMRRFSRETQRNYVRDVGRFATSWGAGPIRRPRMRCVGSRSSSRTPARPCRP